MAMFNQILMVSNIFSLQPTQAECPKLADSQVSYETMTPIEAGKTAELKVSIQTPHWDNASTQRIRLLASLANGVAGSKMLNVNQVLDNNTTSLPIRLEVPKSFGGDYQLSFRLVLDEVYVLDQWIAKCVVPEVVTPISIQPIQAEFDITPPVIDDIELPKTARPGETISLRIRAHDDKQVSWLPSNYYWLNFVPVDHEDQEYNFYPNVLSQEQDDKGGIYIMTFALKEDMKPGLLKLKAAHIEDFAGNSVHEIPAEIGDRAVIRILEK